MTNWIAQRYECQRLLSHVGSRYVWKAFDHLLGRLVVIKGATGTDGTIEEEYRLLQRCAHPRIVRAFDLGRQPPATGPGWEAPERFLTQEWLTGPSLRDLAGRLDSEALESLARDALDLLAFLHMRGVTRLDLKPHHFFRTEVGWKLIDLDQAQNDRPLGGLEQHGTLAYIAPECLGGDAGGPQADLFSLGAVLFEAMTGAPPPLEGNTLDEVRAWLEGSTPLLPAPWPQRSPVLATLISRLLARKPVNRPSSAEEALLELESPEGWRSRCPLPETSLYGRDPVIAALRTHLEDARRQEGGGALITAPVQGGRSRLLSALKDLLQEEGQPALLLDAATCRTTGLSPLSLLMKHLSQLAGMPAPTAMPGLSSESASREPIELLITSQPGQLRERARTALERLGAPVPFLLDDLEQVDTVTRQVLERLACYLAGSGLLLILGAPDDEAVRAGLSALPVVSLPPLDTAALRSMAEEVLGPGAFRSEEEVRDVRVWTGGRPGSFRSFLTLRWRAPSDAQAGLEQFPEASASPPPALADAARALSICGHPFTVELGNVLLEEASTSTPLEDLIRLGVLIGSQAGETDELLIRFSDEALRRSLEGALSSSLRLRLHQRAAEALERQLFTNTRGRACDIATHFLNGGMETRAIPYLQRAIADARSLHRPDEVAHHLAALAALTPAGDAAFPELCRQRGEALAQLGDLREARSAFEAALEHEDLLPPPRRALCVGELGGVLLNLGNPGEARLRLEKAVELSRAVPSQAAARLHWLHQLVWLDLEANDLSRAEARLQESGAMAEAREPAGRIDEAHLHALLAMKRGTADARIDAMLGEALELAQVRGNSREETKLLNTLARLARQRGDVRRARDYLEQLVERARASWDAGREAFAAYNLGTFLMEQQAHQAALEQFERAATLSERQGNGAQEMKARIECVALLLEHDKLDRAESMLARLALLRQQLPASARNTRLALEVFTGRLRLKRGALEGLDAELEALEEAIGECQDPYLALEILADRMELALRGGRPLEALRYYGLRRDTEEHTEAPAAWQRIHALAIRAHEQQALTLPGQQALTLPGPQALLPAPEPGHRAPQEGPSPHPQSAAASSTPATATATLELPARNEQSFADLRVAVSPSGLTPSAFPWPTSSAPELAEQIGLSTPEWLQVLRRLLEVSDEEDLLAAELAALAGRLFQGRGLVFLFEGTRLLAGQGYGLEAQQVDDVSNTILEQVRERREPFICPDVRANQQLGQLRSLREARVRSVLCHPVLLENACLGVIYIDHVEVGRVTAPQALAAVAHITDLTSGLLAASLRRRQLRQGEGTRFGLLGNSQPMQRLKAKLDALTSANTSDLIVLLLGETGTGKSTIARLLHEAGTRRTAPFVSVNAASIPDTLFESLMFGYMKGAFTGAFTPQAGWLEMARGGTLFLDEVGDMPLAHQARLLDTFGGARRFRRLGAEQDQSLDLHLICATSRNLKLEVEAGRFRSELLRRIQVNTCRIPPLRERGPEDIHLLACHMITAYLGLQRLHPSDAPMVRLEDFLSRQAREHLYRYEWPWNVGEMENLFRNEGVRGKLRTLGREKVELEEVLEALDLERREPWTEVPPAGSSLPPLHLNYKAVEAWCDRLKAEHMRRVFQECDEHVTDTARRMGCSRDVVYKYLELARSAEEKGAG